MSETEKNYYFRSKKMLTKEKKGGKNIKGKGRIKMKTKKKNEKNRKRRNRIEKRKEKLAK